MRVNDVTRELDGLRNEDIFYVKFKSGGSSSLAVNGAVTPVVFTLEDLAITVRDDLTAIPYIEFAAYGIKLN